MKKIWSIVLVVTMLLSMLPMGAFAESYDASEVVGTGSTSSTNIIDQGDCGDNLTWVLDDAGHLLISGTGEMYNWDFWYTSAPWLDYSDQIKKVIIEAGVTSIGMNAFCSEDSYYDEDDRFYSELTEIFIPNTVTTIQTNGISGLDVLETITLPASLTTMVGAAINNNYALKNYVVAEENPVYKTVNGVLYSKDGKTLIGYPIGRTTESYMIPDGTKTIAAYAFSQCSSALKEVIFNEELVFIDDEAFQNCDGLTSIDLPDSLKQLGGGVFQECSNLSDISLPRGMTRIGGRAFDATAYYNDFSNWQEDVLYLDSYLLETTYITPELDWDEWIEKTGTLVVRDGTTLIADESVDSSSVDAVVFNNELEHIGFAAFSWLPLTSVHLPDSLISLGDWAFYYCDSLEDLYIGPNLQYIGHDVFGETPYDNDANYVDGVLYYGPYVLGFNDNLPSNVVLRDGTTLIAERAFWKEDGMLTTPDYGAGMSSISFPESLTTICDGAFYSCNNLKEITIPDTVTYIGHQAYGWIKGYDTDIEEETFDKMTDVTIKGYTDTAAETYAMENDITFIALDNEEPTEQKPNVAVLDENVLSDRNRVIFSEQANGTWAYNAFDGKVTDNNADKWWNGTNSGVGYLILDLGKVCEISGAKMVVTTNGDRVLAYNVYVATSLGSTSFVSDNKELIVNAIKADTTLISNEEHAGAKTIEGLNATGRYLLIETTNCYVADAGKAPKGATVVEFELYGEEVYIEPELCDHAYFSDCYAVCYICGEGGRVAPHNYKYACDDTCDSCGAMRIVSHAFDNACDKDCNLCDANRLTPDHVYTNNCDAECNVCGDYRTPGAHAYENGSFVCYECGAVSSTDPSTVIRTNIALIDETIESERNRVIASSAADGTWAYNAFDGKTTDNNADKWWNGTDNGAGYLIIDLGRECDINGAKLTVSINGGRVLAYEVYVVSSLGGIAFVPENGAIIANKIKSGTRFIIGQKHAGEKYFENLNATGRYVLIETTDCYTADANKTPKGATISEVEIYGAPAGDAPKEEINLALGKNTISSGEENGYGAEKAVDGNTSGRQWMTNGVTTATAWMAIDLGANIDINAVKTFLSKGSTGERKYCYDLYLASASDFDGEFTYVNRTAVFEGITANGTLVATVDDSNSVPGEVTSVFETSTGRYLLIHFVGCVGTNDVSDTVSLYEIEVYNKVLGDDDTSDEEDYSYLTFEILDGEATVIDYDYENVEGEIVIPESISGYPVTRIGELAFSYSDTITRIILPNTITHIEDAAFAYCYSLEEIIIPDSVISIGEEAFAGCEMLTSITIPKGVETLSGSAFSGCMSLEEINVDEENEYYSSINGVLFNKTQTELIYYPSAIADSSYSIPEGVVTIGDNAFCLALNLTTVTISNTVTTIGEAAFLYCSGLTDIVIPYSVKNIGALAFALSTSLTDIVIPNTVTNIDEGVFLGCTGIKNVTLPKSITNIGEAAFGYCLALENIYYQGSNDEFENITIGLENETFTNATFYYNACIGAADHKYDNACDATCNLCGEERVALNHKFDNNCDTTCNECGEEREVSGHDYEWIVDKTEDCGNAGSKHQECSACGDKQNENTEIPATGDHKYDNACDATCNVCGAERVALNHKFDNNCDTTCNECGEEREVSDHDYKENVTKATLTKNGKIVNKCEVCGKVESTTTVYYPKTFSLSKTSYTYNGKAQKPTVTVKDSKGKTISSSNYTVKYSDGCKNAGTYTVTVTMKGNYSGTKKLTYKINPIDVSKCKISLSKTSYTYNGKVQKPSVTVKSPSGAKLTSSSYTVKYSSDCKNAGTYTVTVTMKGNYSGTKKLTYKINPAKISSYKLSAASYTYNGKTKTPSVTVKNASGTKLTKNTHFTVTYSSGRKNVGTYKVTIKGKGNYTGTKTLTYKINPVKTTVSKLSGGKKQITVNITKKTTQVSGYEVQYSTSKKFTNAKTKTISSNKTTKYTLKSLSAKKTYYVRVRTYKTVNGKKYYSGWSSYKSVKTK